MSMTTGDDLGKSNMFVQPAVALFPLALDAARQGMTMKEFERGLLVTGQRELRCCRFHGQVVRLLL